MLKKKPEHRYQSMDEVIAAIDQLAQRSTAARTAAATKSQTGDNPYDNLRAHIELMLKKGQYTTAIQDLERLASQKAPAAQQAAAWARTKLPDVRAEAKAMSPAGLAALLQTASSCFRIMTTRAAFSCSKMSRPFDALTTCRNFSAKLSSEKRKRESAG